ncbi:hypothetical protein SEUCBS140593_005099 [Sporothrix eucalyptigena]|uniref:Tubulin-tyrosine ligase n=1 Tax=Sporothrix eucalyptigena TaxID=1812306 RepID=A0ABP0BTS3_9PEZI
MSSFQSIVSVVRDGYRAATSKAAQRTYIYATLLAITSSVLYGVAIIGYLAFYREYVPHQVRSAPIHLQYGPAVPAFPSTASSKAGSRLFAAESAIQQHFQGAHHVHHPFALTDLRGLGLKTDQDYDVSVVLSLPRSPGNEAVGNFMVELALAASSVNSASAAITSAARLPPANPRDFLESGGKKLLFAAARPALMTYTDPLVAQATRLTLLPLHFFAPETASRTRLIIPMAESLSFSGPGGPSSVLPAIMYVELRTNGLQELQTYGAEVVFSARLSGLRWLMYHHRIFSFLLLTTTWWLVEVAFMLGVFIVLGIAFGGRRDEGAVTSRHGTNGSNTPRPGSSQRHLKPDEGRSIEGRKTPERKVEAPANVKREPLSIKKEETENFETAASQLAAIPPKIVAPSTSPAKKETNTPAAVDTKAKPKQTKVDSHASTPTKPSSNSGNRKPSNDKLQQEGDNDDTFDDDYDDEDYDAKDDEDDDEPIIPNTPSRKQNKSQSGRASSPATQKKASKPKDSAVATGRSANSPTEGETVRQRPPKKEVSNLSTTSRASASPASPTRKKVPHLQEESQN